MANCIYILSSLNKDEKTATLTIHEVANTKSKKKPDQEVQIDRAELLKAVKRTPVIDTKPVFIAPHLIKDPMGSFDLKASIITGVFLQAVAT